jgi:hypothetical protein
VSVSLSLISDPIMQARAPPLPKLYPAGVQAVSTPVRWAWRLCTKACFRFYKLLLELLTTSDRSALCRGNRADTTLQRADTKVGITFFSCDTLDNAFNTNLSLQVVPVKT